MNDIVCTESGKSAYLTPSVFTKLIREGCPHDGGRFVEKINPINGGKYWGCKNCCKNSVGSTMSISYMKESKRRKDIKTTHPYKASGF